MRSKNRRLWIVMGAVLMLAGLVSWPPARANQGGPRRWALVVGVDRYDSAEIAPLRFAGADARLMAQTLIDVAGFSPRSVVLLTSDGTPNEHPSSLNILRWLAGFGKAVQPDDTFLFYFSGHGLMHLGHSFMVTADTTLGSEEIIEKTSLGVDEMKEQIKGIHASRILEVVDACRNDPHAGQTALGNILRSDQANQMEIHRADLGSGDLDLFATLFACAPGHRSFEGKDGHGYFTYYLVRGLRGEAAGSGGSVTLQSLLDYVRKAVPEAVSTNEPGRTQVPFGDVHGHGATSFVLSHVDAGSGALAANTPIDSAEPVVHLDVKDGEQTVQRGIYLQGSILYGKSKVSSVSVAVNGQPVQVVRDDTTASAVGESLRVALDLAPGDNAVTVTALSTDGTPVQKTITIKCTADNGRITASNPDVQIFAANELRRGHTAVDKYINKWGRKAADYTLPEGNRNNR